MQTWWVFDFNGFWVETGIDIDFCNSEALGSCTTVQLAIGAHSAIFTNWCVTAPPV